MLRVLSVLVAVTLSVTGAATNLKYRRAIQETDKFLQAVTEQGAFSGTVSIIKDGVGVFDGAYGEAGFLYTLVALAW